ncbi:MAG: hypothetical protein U1F56_12115 [Rubrivivax sp.]
MAIVHKVLGSCPGCGTPESFGNVMIHGTTLSRGCKSCKYWRSLDLPPLRKKIVYLDQSLLSAAFKGSDSRAQHAVSRVGELASQQLLVAPHSNLHEDESHQWAGYDGKTPTQLMNFIEQTARGVELRPAYEVEQTQIYKGFLAHIASEQSTYHLEERDALSGDVHCWQNYVYVSVRRPVGDPAHLASLKRESVDRLVAIFDRWAESAETFDEQVAMEVSDAGREYLNQYATFVARVQGGDLNAFLDATVASRCVPTLLRALPSDAQPEAKLRAVIDYFKSDHFSALPYQWLSARVFATLREMVRGGAFANRAKATERLSGVFFDVQHIATYAPYVDVMFVDNQMANLVAQPTVQLAARFGTHVFSLNSIDRFLDWMTELERSMSSQHRDALQRAYGSKE